MIEEWIQELGLYHLNQSDRCTKICTYGRPNGPRSAVDHILVNSLMEEGFRGMSIDEKAEEINISDHNMVRSWFRIGRGDTRR